VTGLVAPGHKVSEGSVSHVLERALEGERISDAEALTLLESRDLVAVGRAAHEIRRSIG
jgi:2-iminoacetate synthase ThiH